MIAEGVEGKAGFIRGLRARPLTAFDHMTPRGHSGRVHEVVSYATLRLARFRVRWNSRACAGHPLREWAPSRVKVSAPHHTGYRDAGSAGTTLSVAAMFPPRPVAEREEREPVPGRAGSGAHCGSQGTVDLAVVLEPVFTTKWMHTFRCSRECTRSGSKDIEPSGTNWKASPRTTRVCRLRQGWPDGNQAAERHCR